MKNKKKSSSAPFYKNLKWMTKEEARRAERERARLLQSLYQDVCRSFSGNKLHKGMLSPGCTACGQGYWSCLYINGLCTANCFYCAQDRGRSEERSPKAEGNDFEDAEDYVSYLEKFRFKGVGISGGESFLVFEKLLKYVKAIKRKFGNRLYLWVYTNGDLVTEDKLRQLKEAGLDEIRFNISAREYVLKAVRSAVGVIDTVTVEIPCIPEDYEKVKKSLVAMQKSGVDFLNLHQLAATEFNFKNFAKHGYAFLKRHVQKHEQNVHVFESEIAALKLLKYAMDHHIDLPINYCSGEYKARLQKKGRMQRYAVLAKDDFEDLTGSGYLRRFSIRDSPARIRKAIQSLRRRKCCGRSYSLTRTRNEIVFGEAVFKQNVFKPCDVNVSYFALETAKEKGPDNAGTEVRLPSGKSFFIVKKLVHQWKCPSLEAKKSFQRLFLEHAKQTEIVKYLFNHRTLGSKKDLRMLRKEMEGLLSLKPLEFLEEGFPSIS